MKSASVHECLRSTGLCAPNSCPQRPPLEPEPKRKQSLRFALIQGNQAFLRDSVPGARKRHPNLPRFACADLRCATPPPLR
jgi:hypothetical protein